VDIKEVVCLAAMLDVAAERTEKVGGGGACDASRMPARSSGTRACAHARRQMAPSANARASRLGAPPSHPARPQVKDAMFMQQQRLARLEALCRALAPQQKPADTLAALGVFDFYPYLAALMCGHQWGPGVQQAGTAYLNYISNLNQARGRGVCKGRPPAGLLHGAAVVAAALHPHAAATHAAAMHAAPVQVSELNPSRPLSRAPPPPRW
jgi:hypothetical protein